MYFNYSQSRWFDTCRNEELAFFQIGNLGIYDFNPTILPLLKLFLNTSSKIAFSL